MSNPPGAQEIMPASETAVRMFRLIWLIKNGRHSGGKVKCGDWLIHFPRNHAQPPSFKQGSLAVSPQFIGYFEVRFSLVAPWGDTTKSIAGKGMFGMTKKTLIEINNQPQPMPGIKGNDGKSCPYVYFFSNYSSYSPLFQMFGALVSLTRCRGSCWQRGVSCSMEALRGFEPVLSRSVSSPVSLNGSTKSWKWRGLKTGGTQNVPLVNVAKETMTNVVDCQKLSRERHNYSGPVKPKFGRKISPPFQKKCIVFLKVNLVAEFIISSGCAFQVVSGCPRFRSENI